VKVGLSAVFCASIIVYEVAASAQEIVTLRPPRRDANLLSRRSAQESGGRSLVSVPAASSTSARRKDGSSSAAIIFLRSRTEFIQRGVVAAVVDARPTSNATGA
jgi:hypothetical protein